MICGYTPFFDDGMDQVQVFQAIVNGAYAFPEEGMSPEAKELIAALLQVDPTHRIGSLAGGSKDIFRHQWFEGFSFEKLRKKELEAPWVPKVEDALDVSNFDSWDHLEDKGLQKDPPISAADNAIFKDF